MSQEGAKRPLNEYEIRLLNLVGGLGGLIQSNTLLLAGVIATLFPNNDQLQQLAGAALRQNERFSEALVPHRTSSFG